MSLTANLSSPSFLSLLKNGCIEVSQNPNCDFFMSFEDALWRYLSAYPQTSKVALIPDFFCSDVSGRLAERGFELNFYPLDLNLRFQSEEFIKIAQLTKPNLIIVYYPMGMRDSVPDVKWFRQYVPVDCLIIEDCADCVLEAQEVSVVEDFHIVIDSLRKVLPIQGARIWSSRKIPPSHYSITYGLSTSVLWNLYRLMGAIYSVVPFSWVDNLRWYVFGIHSDLIGSQTEGSTGNFVDRLLNAFINRRQYKKARGEIVNLYIENFERLTFNPPFGLIEIDSLDITNARFAVFRGPKDSLPTLVSELDNMGISTDIHFEDSGLGAKYDFLLLPTTLSLTDEDIKLITYTCFKHHTSYKNP